jgi:hypothetical protein
LNSDSSATCDCPRDKKVSFRKTPLENEQIPPKKKSVPWLRSLSLSARLRLSRGRRRRGIRRPAGRATRRGAGRVYAAAPDLLARYALSSTPFPRDQGTPSPERARAARRPLLQSADAGALTCECRTKVVKKFGHSFVGGWIGSRGSIPAGFSRFFPT